MSGVEAAKRLAARTAVDAFVKNGFKLGIGSGQNINKNFKERFKLRIYRSLRSGKNRGTSSSRESPGSGHFHFMSIKIFF